MTGSVLIIGASRGIGLGFAQSYALDGWEVHATTRTPGDPGALGEIAGNVSIHGLEVRDQAQISALSEVFEGRGLDVLIHSAGVLRGVTRDEMRAINADAPFDVVEALMPAVLRGPGPEDCDPQQPDGRTQWWTHTVSGLRRLQMPAQRPVSRSWATLAVGRRLRGGVPPRLGFVRYGRGERTGKCDGKRQRDAPGD